MVSRVAGASSAAIGLLLCAALGSASEDPGPPNIVLILADDVGWTDVGVYWCHRDPGSEACPSSGRDLYETPHLDALAAHGIRFSRAYANRACAPTRASLHTGRYPARHGVYKIRDGRVPEDAKFDPVPNNAGRPVPDSVRCRGCATLPPSEVTIAELLAAEGDTPAYATAHIGKWQIGNADTGTLPIHQGFDRDIGHNWFALSVPYPYFGGDDPSVPYPMMPGRPAFESSYREGGEVRHEIFPDPEARDPAERFRPGEYLTDRQAAEARRFIHEQRRLGEGPFFLVLSLYAVHPKLQAKPEYVDVYRCRLAVDACRSERGGCEPALREAADACLEDADLGAFALAPGAHRNAVYAAMMQSLDEAVGTVVQALDEPLESGKGGAVPGIGASTLIVFTSDNGGNTRSGAREAAPATSNEPLRGGKGDFYEGGIRVPLIVSYPPRTGPGQLTDAERESAVRVSEVDILPSLLAAAGRDLALLDRLAPPAASEGLGGSGSLYCIDGSSFWSTIDSGAQDAHFRSSSRYCGAQASAEGSRPPLFWHFPSHRPAGAIRQGDFKLIDYFGAARPELYDLRSDPGEHHNLAQCSEPRCRPEKAAELLASLQAWRQAVSAPMPRFRGCGAIDRDGDAVFDQCDNCTGVRNPRQTDADGDGIGNACDADFDDDGVVAGTDFGLLGAHRGHRVGDDPTDAVLDTNDDGRVDGGDYDVLRAGWGAAAGPTASWCNGSGFCGPSGLWRGSDS